MIGASELAAAQGAYTFMAGALITLVVGGVFIARRLGGGLAPWAWGGVAFVLSQAARLPALTLISALVIGSAAPESGSARAEKREPGHKPWLRSGRRDRGGARPRRGPWRVTAPRPRAACDR